MDYFKGNWWPALIVIGTVAGLMGLMHWGRVQGWRGHSRCMDEQISRINFSDPGSFTLIGPWSIYTAEEAVRQAHSACFDYSQGWL